MSTPEDSQPTNEQLQTQLLELSQRLEHRDLLVAELQAVNAKLHEQLTTAAEQIALLKKALFGRRSERFTQSPHQPLLFPIEPIAGDEQSPSAPAEAAPPEPEAGPRRRRRPKRKRFEFPQFLAVTRIEHPLPPDQLACPCGCGDRVVIGEEIHKQLELIAPSARVLEQVRFTYACSHCRQGANVTTSPKPANINEKGVFAPKTIGFLGQAKFERHLPVYRLQEEIQAASGMWFSRSVLCGALIRAALGLRPLRDLIHGQLLRSFYLRIDETTARVLRPGAGKTELVYLWVYVGDADFPYRLFDYQLERSRAGPREILGDYRGGILSDGHSAYSSLIAESQGKLVDLGCWAHARRRFDEALAVTNHAFAPEGLAWVRQLYDIEDRIKPASFAQRLQVRQQESRPILDQLHKRMVEIRPTLRPSSKLAEAIQYPLNRWESMCRFVTDGRYAIDNNEAERGVRPSVIGRKNYLFFGSDRGGEAAAIWYTIVNSARFNNLKVLPYLYDLLERVPQIVPEYLTTGDATRPFDCLRPDQVTALEQLLPDRWLQAHPEHRSDDRQRELDDANDARRRNRARRRAAVKA